MANILSVEWQLFGHHPSFMRMVSKALLSAGHQLTLAVPDVNKAKSLIGNLENKVQWVTLQSRPGDPKQQWAEVHSFLQHGQGDHIFFNGMDEILPKSLRRAAFGWTPPQELKGKVHGIFIRPRCLDPQINTFKNGWKRMGWKKLSDKNFFGHVFILDEILARNKSLSPSIHWLPDPWEEPLKENPISSKKYWNLPTDKKIFLFYGTGNRRKGLDLLLETFESDLPESLHLFCVGAINPEDRILKRMNQLKASGRLTFQDRYISVHEEKLAFSACDVVVLPYRSHYGSSGLLPRAAQAMKPVISSDYGLLGQRVRDHGLGHVFKNEDPEDLTRKLRSEMEEHSSNLENFSEKNSPEAFLHILSQTLQL